MSTIDDIFDRDLRLRQKIQELYQQIQVLQQELENKQKNK